MRKVAIVLLAAVPLVAQNPAQPAVPPAVTSQAQSASATSAAPFGLAALAPQASDDASAKKAKEVMRKMIEAMGGEAYLSWTTMTQRGRTYAFYQGQPNSVGTLYWRFYKYPDKERLELTKERDVVYIINGNEGYEITYKGTTEQEQDALEESLRRRNHSLDIIIRDWLKDPGTLVIHSGTGTANQRMVEKVTLINAKNDSATIAIDPNDMLPVTRTYSYRNPVDNIKDEESDTYANYRRVQGIMTAHTISRLKNEMMVNQRFINEVSYNVPIEDSKFESKVTYSPYKLSPKR